MRKASLFLIISAFILAFASTSYAAIATFDISYYRLLKTDVLTHDDVPKVEEVIRYCADALYEATNGEMTLGTVRIFQAGTQHMSDYKQTDIIWEAKGHPAALPGAGAPFSVIKQLGQRINMYDTFTTSSGDINFLADNENMAKGGYALASIISSYCFNLRSEYAITRGGTSFTGLNKPSIMNNPFDGLTTAEALNYSTKEMYTEGVTTEQYSRWGSSAWDTMEFQSPLSKKPKKGKPNTIQIEPGQHKAEAQKNLRIVWVSSPIYVLTIDTSGSMSGERIAKAKAAAKDYVKNLTEGKRVGIMTFDSDIKEVAPITKLTKENMTATKKELISRIDAISLGGNTAMYDGCVESINSMISQPGAEFEGKYVILFSDGGDNASQNGHHATIKYAQDNHVSISPIGLEDGIDVKVLQELAEETSGRYLLTSAPIDTQEIMYNYFSHSGEVQSSVTDNAIKAGAGGRSSFFVEQGAQQLRATVITDTSGSGSKIKITARSPKGKNVAMPYDPTTDKHELLLEKPEPGNWTLNINNSGNNVYIRTSTYEITPDKALVPFVQAVNGPNVGEIMIYASVTFNGLPIAGMKVSATMTGGNLSAPLKLEFNDAGLEADVLADDGIYSASYDGELENGNYRIAASFNAKGNVSVSTLRYYLVNPGESFTPKDKIALTGGFERAAVSVFQVKNRIVADNFAKTPMDGQVNYERLLDRLDMAERAMKRNDFDLAHSYIKEALRIWPEDYRVYLLEGKIYDAANEHTESLLPYRKAMMYAPYWAENYYRYGQAWTYLKDKEEATFVLERMQYLFPENTWTGKMEAAYKFIFRD